MVESDKKLEFIYDIHTDVTMNIVEELKILFIERLLFPTYSAACFTKDMSQSNMWSHYADGHKGVCLKFNAYRDENNGLSLKVNHNNKNINFALHKVKYSNKCYLLNFFDSINQLQIETYIENWCKDKKGNYTKKKLGVLSSKDQWQTRIENNQTRIFTSKLMD